jgi:L-ascorbate metabolism protein UlaG (beta-lactamase superfamily)
MSTPRLPERDKIEWSVPFDSPDIDELFTLDRAPKPLGHIREMLGRPQDEDELLLPLLSTGEVAERPRWEGDSVRISYLGHACVLVEWRGVSILTDPGIGVVASDGGIERLTFKDMPDRIDFAIVTHNHHDHFCMETLLRLRHKIDCLVVPRSSGVFYGDLSLKLLARKNGFRNVIEVDALDSIEISDGAIFAIPFMGEHADLPHGKTAYVIRAGSQQILFGADSDCLDENIYKHLRRLLGRIETVFLGMECVGAPLTWSCGPFLPARPKSNIDWSRRYKGCDSARAMRILEAIGAKRIYIYAMGIEPWMEHLLGLAYTEDATQLKEAQSLLQRARERRFEEADLLIGKRILYLADDISRQTIAVTQAHEVAAGRSPHQADEEFVFD